MILSGSVFGRFNEVKELGIYMSYNANLLSPIGVRSDRNFRSSELVRGLARVHISATVYNTDIDHQGPLGLLLWWMWGGSWYDIKKNHRFPRYEEKVDALSDSPAVFPLHDQVYQDTRHISVAMSMRGPTIISAHWTSARTES